MGSQPKHSPAVEQARRVLAALPIQIRACAHVSRCAVCKLARPDRAELERLYVRWYDVAEIGRMLGVKVDAIRRHAAYYDLDLMRAECHVLALPRILEAGMSGEVPRATFAAALSAIGDAAPPAKSEVPAPSEPGDDASPVSWEEAVRRKRRRVEGAQEPSGDPQP